MALIAPKIKNYANCILFIINDLLMLKHSMTIIE